MVETPPAPAFEIGAFEMAEADFLFQLEPPSMKYGPFDTPALFYHVNEVGEGDRFIECRKPEFRRLLFAFRPFDQKPFLSDFLRRDIASMGRAHPDTREASRKPLVRALPPSDRAPVDGRQLKCELFNAGGLIGLIVHRPDRTAAIRAKIVLASPNRVRF